jgi:hypothetical protein
MACGDVRVADLSPDRGLAASLPERRRTPEDPPMGKRSKHAVDEPVIEVIAASGDLGDGSIENLDAPSTVAGLIEQVAASVVPAARASGAAKFGIEFGVRTRTDGSAVLADEPSRGVFRVFLEWTDRDGWTVNG